MKSTTHSKGIKEIICNLQEGLNKAKQRQVYKTRTYCKVLNSFCIHLSAISILITKILSQTRDPCLFFLFYFFLFILFFIHFLFIIYLFIYFFFCSRAQIRDILVFPLSRLPIIKIGKCMCLCHLHTPHPPCEPRPVWLTVFLHAGRSVCLQKSNQSPHLTLDYSSPYDACPPPADICPQKFIDLWDHFPKVPPHLTFYPLGTDKDFKKFSFTP